jgi:hypothetical protein
VQVNGYALSAASGVAITIEDTCFIDNNFVGDAVVLAESLDLFNQSNVYGTYDEGVECPFALVGGTCIPYSSKTCRGIAGAPTAAPLVEKPNNETSASRRASVSLGLSVVGVIMVVLL